jgi:hypothetical protein
MEAERKLQLEKRD